MNRVNNFLKGMSVVALGLCINFEVVAGPVATQPAVSEYIPPVAGTQPNQRPAGAPVVTTVKKDQTWYKRAETGLQAPFPASFSFLMFQGNWFSPFINPGMVGRYDIRGWHNGDSQAIWRMPMYRR
jgi:hypothetical protein